MADVVAHLVSAQHADRIQRGLQGELEPPVGGTPSGMLSEDDFRNRLAQNAIDLRHQLGDNLLAELRDETDRVEKILSGMAVEDWETPCYHPMGPEPVRAVIDVRLTEFAMHGWDIRASFNPQASLSKDSLPALINTIPRAVRRAFRPDAKRTRPVRYRFQMTEPVATTTDILLNAEGASVESDNPAEADVIFHCDASTAILVIFGRLPLADAIADGRIHVEGEPELAAAFGQSFQGG